MMSDTIKEQDEAVALRSSMCDCEDCRGGVSEAEKAVLMSEAKRLAVEARASTPARMDQHGDKEAWASSVVAKALLDVEMARIDQLLEKGADPRVVQQMLTVRMTEVFGQAFASYLRKKVKGFQPTDFVLLATTIEPDEEATGDLFSDIGSQSGVEDRRRLH